MLKWRNYLGLVLVIAQFLLLIFKEEIEKISEVNLTFYKLLFVLLVFNIGLISIHRSWFFKQWEEFKNTPTRGFIWTDDGRFIFSRLEREPLIFDSEIPPLPDLSFLEEGTESHKRWPKI